MLLKDYIVQSNQTIEMVYNIIDKNDYQIVFVVDEQNKLIASLSDGDIRRHLLAKGSMNDCVLMAGNKNVHTAKTVVEARKLSKEFKLVPILDKNQSLTMLVSSKEVISEKKLNLPVVIQAGGLGTRLYPYTKILPKPLIPVGDVPIIERIINKFVQYGCNDFYVIVNYRKNMIKSYFSELDKSYNISFIDEDIPLGTGGGLSLLKGKIDGDFIFTNCDILVDVNYFDVHDFHKENNDIITLLCAKKIYEIPYGVIKLDDKSRISSIEEKPKLDFLINTGVYLLNSKVVEAMPSNTKIGMPTIFEGYREKDRNSVGVYQLEDNQWSDMGQLEEMEAMSKKLKEE